PHEKNGRPQRASADDGRYEEYLSGRDAMGRYIHHTPANEEVVAATAHFKRAIELEPDLALSHCALRGCYANRVIKAMGDADDYDRAEEEFNKGLALDPKNNEARMHMIFIYLWRGERDKARAEVERPRHEAPNDVGVRFSSACF